MRLANGRQVSRATCKGNILDDVFKVTCPKRALVVAVCDFNPLLQTSVFSPSVLPSLAPRCVVSGSAPVG